MPQICDIRSISVIVGRSTSYTVGNSSLIVGEFYHGPGPVRPTQSYLLVMEYGGIPLISALRHNHHTPLLEFLSLTALIITLELGATGFLLLTLLCGTPGTSSG
jgi:hypothetical protein